MQREYQKRPWKMNSNMVNWEKQGKNAKVFQIIRNEQ